MDDPKSQAAAADSCWFSNSSNQRELDAIGIILSELARPGARVETMLSVVAEKSATTTNASGAAIALLENGEFVCRASYGEAMPAGSKLDINSGFSGQCIRTGSAVKCDDTEIDPRVNADACRAMKVRSIAAVPVKCREEVVGLLEVFSSQARAFDEEHLATLGRMAGPILAAVNLGSPVADDRLAGIGHPEPLVEPDSDNVISGQKIQGEPPKWHLGISTSNVMAVWSALS